MNPNSPPVIVDTSFILPLFSDISSFIGRIIAFDYDFNQTLTYSITNITFNNAPFDSVFEVDASTGDLYLNSTDLFYYDIDCLTVAIQVRDDGVPSLFSESLIPVCLTDPMSLPIDALSVEPIFIEENRGTHICFDNIVSSLYPTLQPFHLFSYTNHSLFTVFDNGTVCIESSLNYELQSFHSLPLLVTFPSFPFLSTSVNVSVFVLDISFVIVYSFFLHYTLMIHPFYLQQKCL